ncbi:Clp protease N-terminal domain-containing protein [Dactylosporangium sp. AC04546]|uniref:Clp protease N-terminal domain-containing protein n=1 Tax=Dactylosporangium sp. AC04546 TaxID=2862460 RepID=UPI001EDD3447|nr:Clp protease N-terminal domain-containing protein [Dactylosporangium sp. AC04546]WVK79632.1 Clp protease N-terminal domain-containing protein [Dactylosporangium sp. AC04546]
MFRGTDPELGRVVGRALAAARELGHPRTGSEHLLLALTTSPVGALLGRHGVTAAAVRDAVCRAAPLGAGAAADREALAPFGIDLDRLGLTPAVLDRAPLREPLLPFGAARARRWCARMRPPLGLDAQAAFEASLRLALARRERDHRPEHLALVLVALDPGAAWVLDAIGADAAALLAALRDAFPPPTRNVLLRAERRIGRNSRGGDLIRRYQRTTGRVVRQAGAVTALIGG